MTSDDKFWLGIWVLILGTIVLLVAIVHTENIAKGTLSKEYILKGYSQQVITTCNKHSSNVIWIKN